MLYEENVYYAEHIVKGQKYDPGTKEGKAFCETCKLVFDYSLLKNTKKDNLGIRVFCPNDKVKK